MQETSIAREEFKQIDPGKQLAPRIPEGQSNSNLRGNPKPFKNPDIQKKKRSLSTPFSAPEWWSSNALTCYSSTHSDVMTIKGFLNGHEARMLIDSGASGNFVNAQFLGNGRETLAACMSDTSPKNVKLANGTTVQANQMLANVNTNVKNRTLPTSFVVLPQLSNSYDAILGMPYLEAADPDISFSQKTFKWRSPKMNLSGSQPLLNALPIGLHNPNTVPVISPHQHNPINRYCQKQGMRSLANVKIPQNYREKPRHLKPGEQFILTRVRDTFFEQASQEQNSKELQWNEISVKEIIPKLHPEAQKLVKRFEAIFPEELPKKLPPKRKIEHRIDLVPGAQPVAQTIYRMSDHELKELKRQIDDLIHHGFIRPSISPYGSPVLFVKKKDGSLRLCVDYRKLNNITIKNSFGLPRADEQIESVRGARFFTKLDLHSGYNQMRVAPEDIEKTAFSCRFGHFEFVVTPFGLCNAPCSFQALMNSVLHPLLGVCVLCYLDDILIYSATIEDHSRDVTKVLELLQKNELYVKLRKCEMFTNACSFLGHHLSNNGISVEEDKIIAIKQWPIPKNIREIQSFLGAASYYRRFIPNFARIACPLTELTRKEVKWQWDLKQQQAFESLKSALSHAPVLMSPNYTKEFTITSDACANGYGGVLSQLDDNGHERPIAYYSKRFNRTEENWSTYEQECFALVQCLKKFRHYIEGKPVKLYTDHKALIHLNNQPNLNAKQARWVSFINLFDYTIKYKEGKTNKVADALSRQFISAEKPEEVPERLRLNHDINTKYKDDYNLNGAHVISKVMNEDLVSKIHDAQMVDPQCAEVFEKGPSELNKQKGVTVNNNLVQKHGRIYVPSNPELRNYLLNQFHDNSGHVGRDKTIDLINRIFYWTNLFDDVASYVKSCIKCQRNKPSNQQPHGLLQPLEIPDTRWSSVAIDFITGLPRSSGFNAILTITDRLTKMVHLIPTVKEATASDIAKIFLRHVVRHHGIPRSIVSDRDAKFTSHFWRELMKLLNINLKMSSANHPECDGQSEKTNRTTIEILRSFVNTKNTNWAEVIPLVEIAINNTKSATTGLTPYFINYGFHPNFTALNDNSPFKTNAPAVESYFKSIQAATELAKQNIKNAQLNQKHYADQKRRPHQFKVGDKVFINAAHFRLQSGVQKLNPLNLGPFEIIRAKGQNTFALKLPSNWRVNNAFHVSKLRLANENDNKRFPIREQTTPPIPHISDDGDEHWEIEQIVDHRRKRNRLEYRVRWKGYQAEEDTWETVKTLANARDALKEYHNSLDQTQLNTIHRARKQRPTLTNPDRKEESLPCKALTKRGQRCRNRTRRSRYCQVHLKQLQNLRITDSKIADAGLGLFVDKHALPKNRIIAPYTGVESTKPIGGDYTLKVNNNRFINANRSKDIAGFANDCRTMNKKKGECKGNNAKYSLNNKTKTVNLVSTKRIQPFCNGVVT